MLCRFCWYRCKNCFGHGSSGVCGAKSPPLPMNIRMWSGKGKDVPECVYEFAFPTANSCMRPGNKPLFRGSIKNHNPRKGTETRFV